ncbi:peptidase [Candidatus Marsarchaeota G1 archaeon OSP_D]|jgi:membrane dipeptidase|uniref:Peptidase n=2 Tax=Candidatus Marsarchaeota group 1 TaxID=2203770 RepID=A0A2R6A7V4_9ARCH|nr:MAG: peptidase [Candidatus Marsarchaeota G1 archaeon OSP_D]PSN88575.1 MAG: peptidase [Candidatus Marsarchaeota G1 archaeon OSP_C]
MRFVDLHEDLAFSSQNFDLVQGEGQCSIKMLQQLGDPLVFAVIFPHINTWDERGEVLSAAYGHPTQSSAPLLQVLWEQFKLYLYLERRGLVSIVRKASDLEKPGVKLLLALEGADVLTDPYDLHLLYEMGLRCVGLTWNYDNKFASSCMSKKDYGLTGYGEELVKLANKLGVLVDVAHAGKATVLDVTSLSKAPVIASHANVKKIRNHVRNLDDEELEAIAKTDGVVGVTAITSALSENPSINDLVTHASYIEQKFGLRHVAIGTDFLGIQSTPQGFENVLKVQELAKLLGEKADKILWENAVRVLKSVLKV